MAHVKTNKRMKDRVSPKVANERESHLRKTNKRTISLSLSNCNLHNVSRHNHNEIRFESTTQSMF